MCMAIDILDKISIFVMIIDHCIKIGSINFSTVSTKGMHKDEILLVS